MNWDTRRKIIYALSFAVALSAVSIFLLRGTLFPSPTCVDHKKNGYEIDVDCGGVCALRCTQEVNPLTVTWAKALTSGQNLYDLVAMINNTNIDNASRQLEYTFTLYDAQGNVMTAFSGVTIAPLAGKFPVIIQNIPLEKKPTHVVATLKDGPHYKVQESPSSPTVKILGRHYEKDSISRVYATIMNTKRVEITNLPIRVVLFDEEDNAFAVGQTIIPVLPKEGVKEIVVTWGEVFKNPPTRIEVYPIFNPYDAIGY
jgi:hypothetical protein